MKKLLAVILVLFIGAVSIYFYKDNNKKSPLPPKSKVKTAKAEKQNKPESLNIADTLKKSEELSDEKKYDEALSLLSKLEKHLNASEVQDINDVKLKFNALKEETLDRKACSLEKTSHSVPILMYHSIDVSNGNTLKIPKEAFRAEMQYLKESGYKFATFREYLWRMENKVPFSKNSVIVTLDDGYEDNYTNAYPVLKEFNIPATIFIITSTTDKNGAYITSSQLKEMSSTLIDFESHTVSHNELSTMPYNKQVEELKNSKAYLENLLGKKIELISYPSGRYNENTIKACKETGYKAAVTTKPGNANILGDPYTITRVRIDTADIGRFKAVMNACSSKE